MNGATIENNFTYHQPKGDQPEKYHTLRDGGLTLARMILVCCPDSAERTLAIRKLEECVMWANASIARNEE